MDKEYLRTLLAPQKRVIGVIGHPDASMSLFWDGLLQASEAHILFIPVDSGETALQFYIAKCDAIVVIRMLLHHPARQVIDIATIMKSRCIISSTIILLRYRKRLLN